MAFLFCKLPRGLVMWYLLPKHSDFILDACLLPLQRFFRDALDRDHLSCNLLPSHHHLGKRTAARAREKERNTLACFICARAILTQKTYPRWVDRGHSEADRPEYTNSILWIFTENWQSPWLWPTAFCVGLRLVLVCSQKHSKHF